jgi:hypothetical protein
MRNAEAGEEEKAKNSHIYISYQKSKGDASILRVTSWT